ncbi:hypothetical protein [Bifidobacterium callitrichidarum]|uniref:hypothetical protein n=1 Tax=Bifidobacterium callitrichidarum TaxID=2052941 RepID=UPI001304877A|nr:hypothetical protein [Bifidobacterium callitrichidarum]
MNKPTDDDPGTDEPADESEEQLNTEARRQAKAGEYAHSFHSVKELMEYFDSL